MKNEEKICAIICEYNPYHNGHSLLAQKARELSGCKYVMAIMSGNFTQRGEPAILDAHSRADIALSDNIDIVVALPTAYSIATSEVFALAGVKVANTFDNVTHLAFGSECGDIELLNKCSDFFCNEPLSYKLNMHKYLRQGFSYNASRIKSLEGMKVSYHFASQILDTISSPNNILALEYLKAMHNTRSKLIPVTIARVGEYNSDKLDKYASASAIRKASNSSLSKLSMTMPHTSFELYKKYLNNDGQVDQISLNAIYLNHLRNTSPEDLRNTPDVTEGLENNIINCAKECSSVTSLISMASSKRYSESKIARILTASVLGVTKNTIRLLYSKKKLPYVKVIGFKGDVLSSCQCKVPLLVRTNDTRKIIYGYYRDLSVIENRSDNLYTLLKAQPNKIPYLYKKTITK